MKIRRFTGSDMRDALRQVRDALGPDAVILETTRGPAGVEISAAIDEAASSQAMGQAMGLAPDNRPSPRPAAARPIDLTDADLAEADRSPVYRVDARPAPAASPYQPPRTAAASGNELDRMRDEMRSIRSLLEAQLARLIWDDEARQNPEMAGMLRGLAQLGLDTDIARRLATRAAAQTSCTGWTAALRTLVEDLPVLDRDLVGEGGTYAVVGPTGAGKTTSIAKLAARAALQDGPGSVGLITADTFRVAAREQLETYGQILGVPVLQAAGAQGLREALDSLRDKRLVLIDTAGMGQRDPRLGEHLSRLAATDTRIEPLLAVPANLQSGAMQEIVDVFRTAGPAACILTKTDETVSLGGALSVLIRTGLPLAYVANGQRVPEDLHLMRNRQSWFAKMAVELMRRENRNINEDEMARNFTEVASNAYA